MDRKTAQWIIAVILTAAGVGAYAIRASEARDPGPLDLSAAAIADGSPFIDESLDADFEDTLRAREILYRMYDADSDAPVWVFLAYFDAQREGSQVHSPRHCYPGAGWSIEKEMEMKADWRDGSLHGLVVSNGEVRRLVCYWYQMPGGITADVFRLKFAMTRQAVLGRPQSVVYGNVSTPVAGDTEAAFARAAEFVRDAETQVSALFKEQNERQ